MRDFLTRYRLFCAARGVDTDVDQNDIERRLKTYGCITRQIVVSRVYGLRWLRKDEAPDPNTRVGQVSKKSLKRFTKLYLLFQFTV